MYWLTDDLTGRDHVLKGYTAPKEASSPADKNIFLDRRAKDKRKSKYKKRALRFRLSVVIPQSTVKKTKYR